MRLLFLLIIFLSTSLVHADPQINAVTPEQQAELDMYESSVADYESGKVTATMKSIENYDVFAKKIFAKTGFNTLGTYLATFFSSFFALGFLFFMFSTLTKMEGNVTVAKVFDLSKTWIFLALIVFSLPSIMSFILENMTTVTTEVDNISENTKSGIKTDMMLKIGKSVTFMILSGYGDKIPPVFGLDIAKVIKPNQYEGLLTIVLAGLLVLDYLVSSSLYLEQIFALKCVSIFLPLICLSVAWARDKETMYDRIEKAIRIMIVVALMVPLISIILGTCNKVYSVTCEIFDLSSTVIKIIETVSGYDVIWKIPIAIGVLFLKVRLVKASQDLAWKVLY